MVASPFGQYVPAIEITRGSVVESVHSAAVAVADARGRLVARLGGIEHVVFLRSSAKPFQTMAVIESGAAEKYDLTPQELALMAGSHSSEAEHVATAAGILAKLGLDVTALQCGTHTPFSRKVAEQYRASGRPLTPLESNCSGKHAGMLAAALAGGHDTASYLDPKHPVQQHAIGVLADLTGRMRDRILVAVDGCSAPTFAVSLAEAARAFARLVEPEGLAPDHRESARRVVAAMRQHPLMVGGEGMLDTELTAHPAHMLISKRGAEGVQCLGFVKDGVGYGVAAKIADGDSGRARVALTAEIVRQLDLMAAREIDRLTETTTLLVRNNSGRDVGVVRGAFTLQRV